jgi:hypothetical protein
MVQWRLHYTAHEHIGSILNDENQVITLQLELEVSWNWIEVNAHGIFLFINPLSTMFLSPDGDSELCEWPGHKESIP